MLVPQLTFLLLARLTSLEFAAAQTSASAIASQYTLTASTTLPFPTATQSSSDAQSLILSQWGLNKARIQDGASNIAFVDDPFPKSTIPTSQTANSYTGPVLRVTYPKGSFNNNTGGTQLYNLWNETTFGSMLLSYEVAFDADFDWVKGGKLPGLRGGLESTGCSGGNQADGQDCFSMRLMWRKLGAGEAYGYFPTPNNLCSDGNVVCNSDFGVSIGRKDFSFNSGQWNRISILVQMNNPPNVANGNLQVYYNDLLAIKQQNLQLRSSSSLSIGGLYLSTFFGGNDDSWATPEDAHSYFRNFQLWGAESPSALSGQQVSGAIARESGFTQALYSAIGVIVLSSIVL